MHNYAIDVVRHHLRIFGLQDSSRYSCVTGELPKSDFDQAITEVKQGAVLVMLKPEPSCLAQLGVTQIIELSTPIALHVESASSIVSASLRTLHTATAYPGTAGLPILTTEDGLPVWTRLGLGTGHLFLLGTDLADDLIRFRQGDPGQAANRPTDAMWGISGERPNYLFEAQVPAGCEHERQADWWAMLLAEAIANALNEPLQPIFPNGAPGAIVITGDDDQAYLEKYAEQLAILKGLPITYFLHPLTRHTPKTLARMQRDHRVELGLHPDALEKPTRYTELYREQARWFRKLTGTIPRLVRNHGFLNDGYWGHLPVWLEQGVTASSNIPGLDGKVLNGSLLPARVLWKNELSTHWSILTAIGDGVRFALKMDGPQSAACIRDLADRIIQSRLPGVIVLNLHPQNITETMEMHQVLHELVSKGFLPMTLGECVGWFAAKDNHHIPDAKTPSFGNGMAARIRQIVGRLKNPLSGGNTL